MIFVLFSKLFKIEIWVIFNEIMTFYDSWNKKIHYIIRNESNSNFENSFGNNTKLANQLILCTYAKKGILRKSILHFFIIKTHFFQRALVGIKLYRIKKFKNQESSVIPWRPKSRWIAQNWNFHLLSPHPNKRKLFKCHNFALPRGRNWL